MGYEVECTLSLDGRVIKGRAALEQQEIVFRGPVRLAIPLGSITSATSRDGSLEVSFSETHTAEKFVIPVAKRQTAAPAGRRRAAKSCGGIAAEVGRPRPGTSHARDGS